MSGAETVTRLRHFHGALADGRRFTLNSHGVVLVECQPDLQHAVLIHPGVQEMECYSRLAMLGESQEAERIARAGGARSERTDKGTHWRFM